MQDQLEREETETEGKPTWSGGREVDFFRPRPRRPWFRPAPSPRRVAIGAAVLAVLALGTLTARVVDSWSWDPSGGGGWSTLAYPDGTDRWFEYVDVPDYLGLSNDTVLAIEPARGRRFAWALAPVWDRAPDVLIAIESDVPCAVSQSTYMTRTSPGSEEEERIALPLTREEVLAVTASAPHHPKAWLVHEVTFGEWCQGRVMENGVEKTDRLSVALVDTPRLVYRHGIIPRTQEIPITEMFDFADVEVVSDVELFRACVVTDLGIGTPNAGCQVGISFRRS